MRCGCHHGCSSRGRAEAMAQATAVAGVWPRLQLRQMQGCMAGLAGAPDAGEFPKQPLRAFFFLNKIPLFKAFTPNKCLASHTAQLSNQTEDYLGQDPSRPKSSSFFRCYLAPQFLWLWPRQWPQSHWMNTTPVHLPLHLYSLQQLQESRSILVPLYPPCLAEEGVVDLDFFQESCCRPSRYLA